MNLLNELWTGQASSPLTTTPEPSGDTPSDNSQAGDSPALAKRSAKSPDDIQFWLVSQLAEQLELPTDDIDIHKDFTEYGLNSIEAVNLSGGLENFLDSRLSPTLVWDYPNIDTLVQHLAGAPASKVLDTNVLEPLPPQHVQPAEAQKLLKNLDQLPDDAVDTLLHSLLPEQALAVENTVEESAVEKV